MPVRGWETMVCSYKSFFVIDLNEDLTGINKDLNAVDETQVKTIDMNQNILDEIDNLPRGNVTIIFYLSIICERICTGY